MDPLIFHTSINALKALGASEGPSSNIFEPKQKAHENAAQLRNAIVNVYRDEASLRALQQLCSCLVFMGTTMMEVEEGEEGYAEVRRAYRVMRWCVRSELPAPAAVKDMEPVAEEEILGESATAACVATAATGYTGCVAYMAVHNALGLYLSEVDPAKSQAVLTCAESLYKEWNAWWSSQSDHCAITDLPIGADGTLSLAAIAPDRIESFLLRFHMDSSYTSTLFFMAQLYAAGQDTTAASQYCHRTMYYQLLNKQEFNAKSWASNALQLSGFYSSHFAYDMAYHCLMAGQVIMPVEGDPADAQGLVAWAIGRFCLHRLRHYGGLLEGSEPEGDDTVTAKLEVSWLDFPGMPPRQALPPIRTFEEARECFKEGMRWLQEAQTCRPFETCCIEHIDVAHGMVHLLAALQIFESNRSRRIAMVQRQISLLEGFPKELNFNAYPVVVRQLLYDLGSLYEDQMRLRVQQRKKPQLNEKPLADKPFNALVSKAQHFYTRFCETWRNPNTQVLPDVLEEESRLPFFRALMRLAQLQLSYVYGTPKEEYDGIGVSCKAYARVMEFYEKNAFSAGVDAEVSKEVEMAREMMRLLPVKQRDLWIAFQRSSAV